MGNIFCHPTLSNCYMFFSIDMGERFDPSSLPDEVCSRVKVFIMMHFSVWHLAHSIVVQYWLWPSGSPLTVKWAYNSSQQSCWLALHLYTSPTLTCKELLPEQQVDDHPCKWAGNKAIRLRSRVQDVRLRYWSRYQRGRVTCMVLRNIKWRLTFS